MDTSMSGSLVNLVETAANDNSFTTFSKVLVATGLGEPLQAQSAGLGEPLQAQSATIKMIDRKVMIDAGNVALIDIASSNGVIHAIDAVLIPTKH